MIDALSLALVVTAVVLAVSVTASAVAGRFVAARFLPALALLEVVVLVQAALDLAGLAHGHQPGEVSTHLAYLVVSVVVLPVAVLQVNGAAGRWAGVLLAVALIAFAVLVIRLQTTWRPAA